MTDRKAHWESIYQTKTPEDVSWYKPRLDQSLKIIRGLSLSEDAKIIDVGGGTSTLPADLLAAGYKNITVLDISSEAIKVSRERLGTEAHAVQWLEADITSAELKPKVYDLWHDRAVFHFLTDSQDRRRYIDNLVRSLKPGGYLLMATFGPNGPLRCSGLEIVRYDTERLQKEVGRSFRLERNLAEMHQTPFGTTQEFLYCLFVLTQKTGAS